MSRLFADICDHTLFSLLWMSVHILGFGIYATLMILTLCSFGFGIGINPPIDIHLPTPDEIKESVKPSPDDGTELVSWEG